MPWQPVVFLSWSPANSPIGCCVWERTVADFCFSWNDGSPLATFLAFCLSGQADETFFMFILVWLQPLILFIQATPTWWSGLSALLWVAPATEKLKGPCFVPCLYLTYLLQQVLSLNLNYFGIEMILLFSYTLQCYLSASGGAVSHM